jgi:energy-converting hydrogenase Eha subunit C
LLLLTALIDVAALEAIAFPVTTIMLYLVLLLFVDGPRRFFITIFLLHTVIEKAATLT